MILNERDLRHQYVIEAAKQIMTAARTAPKGKGIDILEIIMIEGEDIKALSDAMVAAVEDHGMKFFLRDAENILSAEVVILIGTREQVQGLNCGYCGFEKCEARSKGVPCALNSIDLGIAVGSACTTAADLRLDSRVMFSVGHTAQSIGLLKDCSQLIAIPLSASSKNPFFDRKSKK